MATEKVGRHWQTLNIDIGRQCTFTLHNWICYAVNSFVELSLINYVHSFTLCKSVDQHVYLVFILVS